MLQLWKLVASLWKAKFVKLMKHISRWNFHDYSRSPSILLYGFQKCAPGRIPANSFHVSRFCLPKRPELYGRPQQARCCMRTVFFFFSFSLWTIYENSFKCFTFDFAPANELYHSLNMHLGLRKLSRLPHIRWTTKANRCLSVLIS